MSLSIEVTAQPHHDPRWATWVEENDLGLCFRLVPLNEALTSWQGDFYVDDRHGKLIMHHQVGAVTLTKQVDTTPADPHWLAATFR